MYIKNIFDVRNYKGLEDGFRINFDDITYLIGDNAKNKSTIGSLPLWILTGYNMFGGNKEVVVNDNLRGAEPNVIASMTIVDNKGSEHVITRCKGKDDFVLIDGIRTTRDMLAQNYFKDIHAFICSYNPRYFGSLEPAKQKDLLIRLLPAISSLEAFELLDENEKQILENPITDVKGFCQNRRSQIKSLKSELDRIEGSKDTYIKTAIEKEVELKTFSKQQELNNLENEFERLISNSESILNIEELESEIKSLERKINDNVKIKLDDLKERLKKESDNLKNISDSKSVCPTCKQEVKNENMIRALSVTYRRNINTLTSEIDKLKADTKELIDRKENQIKRYNQLKNPENKEKEQLKNELKKKIDNLNNEKTEIDLFNQEAVIKNNHIALAKNEIKNLQKKSDEIAENITKYDKQIKIATRLYSLMLDKQLREARKYLNKVTIEFSRVDEDTGEIIDEYKIKYDGRNYEKLSNSYKLRADIEIAYLINKLTGIETPMFIDDVESITEINLDSNIQTIIALVIKYNELEILYDYSDVLQREKESINKKIEESSNLIYQAA